MHTTTRGAAVSRDSPVSAWACLWVGLAAVLFSSKGVVGKLVYLQSVDPLTLLVLRMGMAAPFFAGLIVWSLVRRGRAAGMKPLPGREDWLRTAALGVLGYYVCSLLDFTGLQFVSSAWERILLFTYPGFTLLLAWAVRGKRPPANSFLGLGVAYAGMVLAFSHRAHLGAGPGFWMGAGLILAAAFLFAVFMLSAEPVIGRMGSVLFSSVSMLGAAAAMGAHFFFARSPEALLHARPVFGHALFLALACTVVPSLLMTRGIRAIGSQAAAGVGSVGPVFTLVLGAIVLGERLAFPELAGMALILLGVTGMRAGFLPGLNSWRFRELLRGWKAKPKLDKTS